MRKIRLLISILLTINFIISLYSCERDIVEPKPKKEPTEKKGEPPEPPPDPPPPPENDKKSGTLKMGAGSLEQIARDVLVGRYGPEIQLLLADEVAQCIQSMAESDIIKININPLNRQIEVVSNSRIYFDMSYIVTDIINGKFGTGTKEVFHYLLRRDKNCNF